MVVPSAGWGTEKRSGDQGRNAGIDFASTRLAILSVDAEAVVDNECTLRRAGHRVELVGSARAAFESLAFADLMLLKLNLRDMDPYEFCRVVRLRSNIPIVAMATTDDELDRVLALQAGADDCVADSCSFYEISARVDAFARRRGYAQAVAEPSDDLVEYFGLTLHRGTREVICDGQDVDVTDTEYRLLALLIERAPSVATREQIMRDVWGTQWHGESRTIDTHVSSIRAKLGSRSWVLSVRGVGYRMGAPDSRPSMSFPA
ncbi:response regulator transcription factor [Rhodococcus sp. NPDC057135]|uniref:response regulator transcription factor n=1 Tax=Rhodococcus sp. NPDC057135 TaxID=3346028 RepID=UPI003635E2F2